MKNILIGILGVLVLAGIAFYVFNNYIYTEKQADEVPTDLPPVPVEPALSEVEYRLLSEGLSFTYLSGPQGYYLEERDTTSSLDSRLVRDIILTPTADYEDQKNRVGGEGSPSWQIAVYTNEEKQSPGVWIEANPMASNIELATDTPREDVVAGANAVRYTIDGLYLTDMVVLAHGDFMFVVSSSYLDENSPTYRDFSSWLTSFAFFEQEMTEEGGTSQGKIDVRVACESALAYMTFPSGEEADAFVAECILGEHPEVIERYILDLGVDGASI